jgi:4-hydroxy-tetrahydrodipicolinate reductase
MKKINIALVGGLGRMGKILAKKILSNKKLKLYSVTDLRAGRYFKNIRIQKNNLDAFKKADVIIDFSRPKSSLEALYYAKKLKKKIVIGTTGFSEKQNKLIKNYSKKIAIFKSGNMSVGINLLEYIIKILIKWLGIYTN